MSTITCEKMQKKIVIVGAGLFGLTTAFELTKRGYKNILILDRNLPPVPDGSSVDISRIIRPDYADRFYAKMGLEAIKGWQETEYKQFFYDSGLLFVAQGENGHPYLDESRQNLESMGVKVESLDRAQVQQRYSGILSTSSDTAEVHVNGYFNPLCGWADAQAAIAFLARQCAEAGVSFVSGPNGMVKSLIFNENSAVIGVSTVSGSSVEADQVILATGAWTPHLIDTGNRTISTGQPVAFLQLTDEEAARWKTIPVIVDLSTGWFVFPPYPGSNLLKMARHGYGYETAISSTATLSSRNGQSVSAPQLMGNNTRSKYIPEDAEAALRRGLALFFPELKDREFVNRRLCWYTDTALGDFVVDHHPSHENLFVAIGGSGHAFKFLPVLGKYLVDNFERKAPPHQINKWSWQSSPAAISKGDGSRGGPPRRTLQQAEQAKL